MDIRNGRNDTLVEKTKKVRHVRFCEELLWIIRAGGRADNLYIPCKSINLDTVVNHTTALLEAVSSGRVDFVELLLNHGASVNWMGDEPSELINLPLHLAIENKWIELARVLLKAGADVNKKNYTHRTPLYVAVESGSSEMVNMLLTNGAAIEVNWATYRCPIITALDSIDRKFDMKSMVTSAYHSHTGKYEYMESMVLTLLRHGVPVNATDVWGNTLLYTALQTTDLGTSRLLIECGAISRRGKMCSNAVRVGPPFRYAKSDPMLEEWIREQLRVPPSLKSLSGQAVRSQLVKVHQGSILGYLVQLRLPKSLVQYLTLERFVQQASLAN